MLLECISSGSKGKLEVENVSSIGPNYVKALRLWREAYVISSNNRTDLNYLKEKSLTAEEQIIFRRKWEVCVASTPVPLYPTERVLTYLF
jgi:cyclopropane-fatty-acyl-phospholipid synthase